MDMCLFGEVYTKLETAQTTAEGRQTLMYTKHVNIHLRSLTNPSYCDMFLLKPISHIVKQYTSKNVDQSFTVSPPLSFIRYPWR